MKNMFDNESGNIPPSGKKFSLGKAVDVVARNIDGFLLIYPGPAMATVEIAKYALGKLRKRTNLFSDRIDF